MTHFHDIFMFLTNVSKSVTNDNEGKALYAALLLRLMMLYRKTAVLTNGKMRG